MKILRLLSITCTFSVYVHSSAFKAEWDTFKTKHAKVYNEINEETHRMKNFHNTTNHINSHNDRYSRGEVDYYLGHNFMSDMTSSEVRGKMLGKKTMSLHNRTFLEYETMPCAGPLPESVDWRKKGIVTPPKDQGRCGACYAFGTISVVESAIARKMGRLLNLSEQQIIDCSQNMEQGLNKACDGGHEMVVMDFVRSRGVDPQESYVYYSGFTAESLGCSVKTGKYGEGLQYTRIAAGDEMKLAEAIANNGPLVVSVSGENRDFQMYRGGIYDNPLCSKEVDHVVSLVGFGAENGKEFWILKNSWGTSWGENGFMKLRKGKNMCGIVSDNSWSISL